MTREGSIKAQKTQGHNDSRPQGANMECNDKCASDCSGTLADDPTVCTRNRCEKTTDGEHVLAKTHNGPEDPDHCYVCGALAEEWMPA